MEREEIHSTNTNTPCFVTERVNGETISFHFVFCVRTAEILHGTYVFTPPLNCVLTSTQCNKHKGKSWYCTLTLHPLYETETLVVPTSLFSPFSITHSRSPSLHPPCRTPTATANGQLVFARGPPGLPFGHPPSSYSRYLLRSGQTSAPPIASILFPCHTP